MTKGINTPVAKSTHGIQILVVMLFSNKRNRGFLEKRPILGLGQEICKMNHYVGPESKEEHTKQTNQSSIDEEGMWKRTQEPKEIASS